MENGFPRDSQVTEPTDRPLQGRGRRFESVNAYFGFSPVVVGDSVVRQASTGVV